MTDDFEAASEPARYIIKYDGDDCPGMVNTVAQCLRNYDFSIETIQSSAIDGRFTTFVTCRRATGKTGKEADKMLLKELVGESVKLLFLNEGLARRQGPQVEVDVLKPDRSRLRIYLDITFRDPIGRSGILADITTLLRPCFDLEAISTGAVAGPENGSDTLVLARLSSQMVVRDIPDHFALEAGFEKWWQTLPINRILDGAQVTDARRNLIEKARFNSSIEQGTFPPLADCRTQLCNVRDALKPLLLAAYGIGGEGQAANPQLFIIALQRLLMLLNRNSGYDLVVSRLTLALNCQQGQQLSGSADGPVTTLIGSRKQRPAKDGIGKPYSVWWEDPIDLTDIPEPEAKEWDEASVQ